MGIDLSRFKVVYDNKTLNALCLQDILFSDCTDYTVRHANPLWNIRDKINKWRCRQRNGR